MKDILICILVVIQYVLFFAWLYFSKVQGVPYSAAISIPFAIITLISSDLEIKEKQKRNDPNKVQIVRCLGCNLTAVGMLMDFFFSLPR